MVLQIKHLSFDFSKTNLQVVSAHLWLISELSKNEKLQKYRIILCQHANY